MFDIFKNDIETFEQEANDNIHVFYTSKSCSDSIVKAFRFNGKESPEAEEFGIKTIRQSLLDKECSLIILELTEAVDYVAELEDVRHFLPSRVPALVIGKADSLRLVEKLNKMGFYYLLWPNQEEHIVKLVDSITSERPVGQVLNAERLATRIHILPSKGGVGATLIASLLAQELSSNRKIPSLIVDHSIQGSNLDIMLGLKNFTRTSMPQEEQQEFDLSYAMSMTTRVNSTCSILSLENEHTNYEEYQGSIGNLVSILDKGFNFVIEDHSSSILSDSMLNHMSNSTDILILVIEPTVSSLRMAKKQLKTVLSPESELRVIPVVNYVRPQKSATVDVNEVSHHLGVNAEIILPFDQGIAQQIIDGVEVHKLKNTFGKKFDDFVSLLLGEQRRHQNNFLAKLLRRK